ncbi:hypothetical protein [Metabacillus fastidiosus]|uniref:hypothetical protein n=1 Tax=Metabacillus fastidiosus TaxID=1458 RepID=UPI003D2A6F7B
MNIENLFVKQVAIEEDFDYKVLYNDDRGAGFKDENKALIREAISKGVITVEKFILAENIQEELYQISETRGSDYTLVECLKNYHNESDYRIAPFIYLLKKLDPDYTISNNEGKLKVVSNLWEVDICPRIDGANAEPRIFFPKEQIAISSTNDNVENLVDVLAVKGVRVYIIGTEDFSNIIYVYKVSRNKKFFDVAENYKENVSLELFSRARKYEI